MTPIRVLINLGLLCWPTVFVGFSKGWLSRKDVIDYAVDLLVDGNDDEGVVIIASGESLEDSELLDLISSQIKQADNAVDVDKWRLGYFINIAESDESEQTKLDNLQEVYANFDYPENMASCSIYSQDEIDPLVSMMEVIKKLKIRLT
jgi:hypothetical protein